MSQIERDQAFFSPKENKISLTFSLLIILINILNYLMHTIPMIVMAYLPILMIHLPISVIHLPISANQAYLLISVNDLAILVNQSLY